MVLYMMCVAYCSLIGFTSLYDLWEFCFNFIFSSNSGARRSVLVCAADQVIYLALFVFYLFLQYNHDVDQLSCVRARACARMCVFSVSRQARQHACTFISMES